MSNDPLPDLPDPHPAAWQLLFDAYRAMGCTPVAVDPSDPEDCAGVAGESVRVLAAAGLLVPPSAAGTQPFTEADVELVRNIIMKRGTAWTYATQDAHRVLSALAAAGRLVRSSDGLDGRSNEVVDLVPSEEVSE